MEVAGGGDVRGFENAVSALEVLDKKLEVL